MMIGRNRKNSKNIIEVESYGPVKDGRKQRWGEQGVKNDTQVSGLSN